MKRSARFLRVFFLGLVLSSLLWVGCPAGAPEVPRSFPHSSSDSKIILLGIDGADWRVLRPLIAEGRLPNFAKIVNQGASGILRSMEPTLSPALWTTVATGRTPDIHQINDFVVRLPGGGYQPVTSEMRAAPAFWNLVGRRGQGSKVGVIGWLASWPAEPVEGFMVTSYLPYLYNWSTGRPLKGTVVEGISRQTYPETLMGEIESLKVRPGEVDPDLLLRFYDPENLHRLGQDATECVEGFLWSLASDETYRRIGLHLFEQRPVDLFAIYFGGVDVVSHRFWKFTHPEAMAYGVDGGEVEILRGVIPGYYEYMDRILGEYLERMDEETTLVVLSDHGFKPVLFPQKPTTSAHHRLEGILILYGRGIAAGKELTDATLLDVLPTLFALLGEPLSRELSGKVLAQAFDLPGTERMTLEYVEAYPARPPHPPSAPGEEVDANVIERLRSLGYIQ